MGQGPLNAVLDAIVDDMNTLANKTHKSMVFNTAGLAIKTTASPIVKTANTVTAVINGVLVSKAAADCAALVGTIAAAKKGLFVFTLKADGTFTTRAGSLTASTLAALTWPTIPSDEVVVGFLIVQNGTASDFVGGTTALDATDITTTYVNTPFTFNPTVAGQLTTTKD